MQTINVNNEILSWAILRAGYTLPEFEYEMPLISKWLSGEKKPTIKQVETFARKIHLPFGYLFLDEPPIEETTIPFFRTLSKLGDTVSLNVKDSISELQNRQNWYMQYLKENGYSPLDFVGKYSPKSNIKTLAFHIRRELGLAENWASACHSWAEALSLLIAKIEDIGINISLNGVVGNNTHRPIEVEECRGYVLVDEYAPFIFVNNQDSKSAQMFTIAHELAHIWIGKSAGFDLRQLQAANDSSEQFCDKVAAEFLVSESLLKDYAINGMHIEKAAKYFKVSPIVIARRALDMGLLTRDEFFQFYDEYITRDFLKEKKISSGGNFYATAKLRIGAKFAQSINIAVKTGQLLYRDAYQLTGLRGDTFEKFLAKTIR